MKDMIAIDQGIEFDTSGPLRIQKEGGNFYLVGEGMLMKVDSVEDAYRIILSLESMKKEAKV